MPLRADISFRLPELGRQIAFRDLHRLACYLAEPASRSAHERQEKDFAIWPLLYDDDRMIFRLHALAEEKEVEERVRTRIHVTPHLGVDLPLIDPRIEVSSTSLEEIARREPVHIVRLEFVSPTQFSRNGRSYPLPDPVVVHQSLVRRWNRFAPTSLRIDEADARTLAGSVALVASELNVDRIPGMGNRSGFVGSATFALPESAGISASLLRRLWEFAEFSGVGALTTQGLGAVAVAGWGD